MTQLISMEPGFQPTSVCAQNWDWFHNIRLPAEEETEAWGGSLGELAQGRALAPQSKKAFGDTEGRQQKLQLLWTLCRTPPCLQLPSPHPRQCGSAATSPRAPVGWGLAWSSREAMPHLCPGGHLQFRGVGPQGGRMQACNLNLASAQGAAQPHKPVSEPAPSSRGLWPARPYLSSRDQRGLFSHVSV